MSGEHPRLMSAGELEDQMARVASPKFKPCRGSLGRTVHSLEGQSNEAVLVCGSFFIMTDFMTAIGHPPQECDP